jgi:hypothetical protein
MEFHQMKNQLRAKKVLLGRILCCEMGNLNKYEKANPT